MTKVHAIGEIYKGPGAESYWSSAKALYHHAYPVGFRSERTERGKVYDQSVTTGDEGPIFSVRLSPF